MYRCICHSCRDNELVVEFNRAQEFFGRHADLGCEVELFRVESSSDVPADGSNGVSAVESSDVPANGGTPARSDASENERPADE